MHWVGSQDLWSLLYLTGVNSMPLLSKALALESSQAWVLLI